MRARFPEKKFGLAINRQELIRRLTQEFLRYGGPLLYGESLVSMEKLSNGLRIKSDKMIYTCDYLIGADGRSSQVAKLAGFDRTPSKNPRVAIHAYIEPVKAISPFGQMHILQGGSYAGVNPISEKEANFSIVTDARLLKGRSAKDLVNHYINLHPALSRQFHALNEEIIKTTYPIDCHRKEIVNDRVALIGDASGFIDPLTGEGITTAIKTAALLFEKLSNENTATTAFAAYSRGRRNDYRQKEALNIALQKIIRFPAACESIALALRAWPRVRHLFIGVIGNIYTPLEAVKRLFLGEKMYVQNRMGPMCFPQVPPFAKGSDEPAKDRLA